ncbi:sugar phosphate isomerase/epimerase [soil metagenome]
MKLGLGSYALAWAIGVPGYPPRTPLDVFGFVGIAAQHGFGVVQIADNLPLDKLSGELRARLKKRLQELNLELEVGTRGIANGNLERYTELAEFFGSSLLRVVVDGPDHHPNPDEVVATVKGVLPRLERANITLAIENHDRFSAASLVRIVTELDSSRVGICLDTVNSFGALEGPGVIVETLGPLTVNLHVKDFAIRRLEHNMGFTIYGTPAGQGLLDVPRLVSHLQVQGRDFNAILELWPAPEATLAETVAKEARWVGESAAYLKKVL